MTQQNSTLPTIFEKDYFVDWPTRLSNFTANFCGPQVLNFARPVNQSMCTLTGPTSISLATGYRISGFHDDCTNGLESSGNLFQTGEINVLMHSTSCFSKVIVRLHRNELTKLVWEMISLLYSVWRSSVFCFSIKMLFTSIGLPLNINISLFHNHLISARIPITGRVFFFL